MPYEHVKTLPPMSWVGRFLALFSIRWGAEAKLRAEIAKFDDDDPEIYEMDRNVPGWNKASMFDNAEELLEPASEKRVEP